MSVEMLKYDKLVRNKIPEIIENDGGKCTFHVAENNEFVEKLKEKLIEEVNEFIEKPSAEEIADILEVVEMLGKVFGIKLYEIKDAKSNKRDKCGSFLGRIILDEATPPK